MSRLFSKGFLVDALERAVKTAAQAAMLVIGQDVSGFDIFSANFANALGFAAGGFLLSLLTSIISAPVAGMSPASVAHGD